MSDPGKLEYLRCRLRTRCSKAQAAEAPKDPRACDSTTAEFTLSHACNANHLRRPCTTEPGLLIAALADLLLEQLVVMTALLAVEEDVTVRQSKR